MDQAMNSTITVILIPKPGRLALVFLAGIAMGWAYQAGKKRGIWEAEHNYTVTATATVPETTLKTE